MARLLLAALLVLVVPACAGHDEGRAPAATGVRAADPAARARQDSINRALPGYMVDSILPLDEELRRFRAATGGDSATRLTGGSASREALVQRFVRALAARDTVALATMQVSAREFSDLYYPESPYARPPYRQSPAEAWRLIQVSSRSALGRLLRRVGGTDLRYVRHRCDPAVAREGASRRHAGCLVEVVDGQGRHSTRRWFGSIVERGGSFKFLSYTGRP